MKKLLITILAFVYLGIASGITVNMHYCMGELASVDYGHDNEENCGKCGMPDNNLACCHTESKLVKLQDDHQLSAFHFAVKQPAAIQPVSPVVPEDITDHSQLTTSYPIHSPPDGAIHTIYLHNCVFRI